MPKKTQPNALGSCKEHAHYDILSHSFNLYLMSITYQKDLPGSSVVKNLPANAGVTRDTGLIPALGKYPRRGNGNPLWYSCLGNPMDRGAWWATVHGVSKSQT